MPKPLWSRVKIKKPKIIYKKQLTQEPKAEVIVAPKTEGIAPPKAKVIVAPRPKVEKEIPSEF